MFVLGGPATDRYRPVSRVAQGVSAQYRPSHRQARLQRELDAHIRRRRSALDWLSDFLHDEAGQFIVRVDPSDVVPADWPVGIPIPPFGLDETIASKHGDANYYTYWIDRTHPSANDANNGGFGSPSLPRLTIPTLTGLAAGTVIQIRGSGYTGATLNISGNGTVSEPIFISGGSAYTTGLERAARVNGASQYLCIEGFRWTTVDESVMVISPTSDVLVTKVCVRDCELIGNGIDTGPGSACSASTSFATQMSDIVWLRNRVHEFGDWTAATENDKHGNSGGINTTRLWELFLESYHCGGDAIQHGHGFDQVTNPTTHVYIGGGEFYQCGENGIDIKQIHTLVISSCELYDFPTLIDAGQCMVLHYGPTGGQGCYGAWVLNCHFHDANIGVTQSANLTIDPNTFIGNLFVNITGAGVSHNLSSPARTRSFHNTFVNVGVPNDFTSDGVSVDIGGNIASTSTFHIRVNTQPDTRTAVKELYYQGGSNVAISWEGSTYTSVTSWIASTSAGDGSLQADPKFANPGAGDYSLQSDSPAIGVGMDMSAIETEFQAIFAATLLKDRRGVVRPNGAWDMGCHQRAA